MLTKIAFASILRKSLCNILCPLFMFSTLLCGCASVPLLDAVKNDDYSKAKEIVGESRYDLRDSTAGDALINAAYYGRTEIARLLIEHGANVNAAMYNGVTPLMNAASRGYPEIAGLLVEHGANVNLAAKNGGTPLINATINGHTEIARMLIEHGANVNTADSEGITPLINATYHGRTEITRLLIEHGANANVAARNGSTPFSNAIGLGNFLIAKDLLNSGAKPTGTLGGSDVLFTNALKIHMDAEHLGKSGSCAAAADGFSRAAEGYQQAAERYARDPEQGAQRELSPWAGIFLGALAGAMADTSAQMQQRDMRQLSALRDAADRGTGVQGYYQGLHSGGGSTPTVPPPPGAIPTPQSPTGGKSSPSAAESLGSWKAQQASYLADMCKRAAECYRGNPEQGSLQRCLEAIGSDITANRESNA
jgi:hypothetical protein